MPADYQIDGYNAPAHVTIDQIHPRQDILLVRRIKEAELTAGGLHVPESVRNPAMGIRLGEVLRIGPGDKFDCEDEELGTNYRIWQPPQCKVGDIVAYNRVPDNDVNIDGVDCVFLREEQHVLAILESRHA